MGKVAPSVSEETDEVVRPPYNLSADEEEVMGRVTGQVTGQVTGHPALLSSGTP